MIHQENRSVFFLEVDTRIYTVFLGLKKGMAHSFSVSDSTHRQQGVPWPISQMYTLPFSLHTYCGWFTTAGAGACAEITLVYWKLMRHSDNHVSIHCEPPLFNMFCLLPTSASIFMEQVDWNHIKSKTNHHWFPLLSLITVVLIAILGSFFFCRHLHTHTARVHWSTHSCANMTTSGGIFLNYLLLFL